MFRGVHYRLLDAAGAGLSASAATAARGRFLTFTGAIGEEYVKQVTSASLNAARAAGALRIHGEVEYHIGKDRLDGPDVVLDAGMDLIVIEVYSGRMSLAARISGDPAPVLEYVERSTAGKLSEMANRITDMLAGQLTYPAMDLNLVERIWPVLVQAGDVVAQSPLLWSHLRSAVPKAFIDDTRVRRATICDLDDLDALLALAEEGHHLPELLAAFLASDAHEHSPRRWVAARFGLNRRPIFVNERFRTVMDAVRLRTFPPGSGS